MNKFIAVCISAVLAQVGGKWIANADTLDMNFKMWGGLLVLAAGALLGVAFASPKSARIDESSQQD